jgi:uncharacterized membrane protein YkoI
MQYRMLLALMCTLFQPMAHAVDIEPGQVKWQLAARQGQLSLSDAADLVQRRTGGRVLSAQAVREQGRELYRIKVLTPQGEVRVVLVDPATGRME